jgi:hypothetical protein
MKVLVKVADLNVKADPRVGFKIRVRDEVGIEVPIRALKWSIPQTQSTQWNKQIRVFETMVITRSAVHEAHIGFSQTAKKRVEPLYIRNQLGTGRDLASEERPAHDPRIGRELASRKPAYSRKLCRDFTSKVSDIRFSICELIALIACGFVCGKGFLLKRKM